MWGKGGRRKINLNQKLTHARIGTDKPKPKPFSNQTRFVHVHIKTKLKFSSIQPSGTLHRCTDNLSKWLGGCLEDERHVTNIKPIKNIHKK
jgi:hypothetical protein